MKVTVLDYGVGNLLSVRRALEASGAEVVCSGVPEEVLRAERLVVPGVGAFGSCMQALEYRSLLEPLKTYLETERPLLGICVGMQMLMESSSEFGNHRGLGVMPGLVDRIPETGSDDKRHKVPHIGWAPIRPRDNDTSAWRGTFLADTAPGQYVYFVHSFAAKPDKPDNLLAYTDYNDRAIAAVIGQGAVVGCQFHPEKSGPMGLKILSGFLSI